MRYHGLILGDMIAIAFVTLVGFASHAEFSSAFVPRMAAAFVPVCIGWFALAPWFGLYDAGKVRIASRLSIPALVMLFAGPFAAVLRGILLHSPVMPIFPVVLSVTGAVALTLWRGLYLLIASRRAA